MKYKYEFSKSQLRKGSKKRCKVCIDQKNKPKSKLQVMMTDIYQKNKLKTEQKLCRSNLNHIANKPQTRQIPPEFQSILVPGYIRIKCDQTCSIFPTDIIQLIFDFYIKKVITFYTKLHGYNLQFTKNPISVKKLGQDSAGSIRRDCLFGNESINILDYDEYRIKFTWYGRYFFMGYLTIPLAEHMRTYRYRWRFLEAKHSVSIKVNRRRNRWWLYDRKSWKTSDECPKKLEEYIYKQKEQEIFEMVFNLRDREWIIYHNDVKAISLPIHEDQETIHVGFGLEGRGNERITILDTSLSKLV